MLSSLAEQIPVLVRRDNILWEYKATSAAFPPWRSNFETNFGFFVHEELSKEALEIFLAY